MSQYPSSWKNCATCAYWAGARESDYFGQNVQVGSTSESGKCAIPNGPWKGSSKRASHSCDKWQKWPVLK